MKIIEKSVPIITYNLFFILFCLVGISVFLTNNESIFLLIEYFSGAILPSQIDQSLLNRLIFLTYVCLFLTNLGYFITNWIFYSRIENLIEKSAFQYQKLNLDISSIVIFIAFALIAWLVMKIYFIIPLDFSTFSDFKVQQDLRNLLFTNLNFFEFFLIYSGIPILGVYALIHSFKSKIYFFTVLAIIVLGFSFFLNLMLMQKKPIVVSFIFTFSCLSIFFYKTFHRKLVIYSITTAVVLAFLSYFLLLISAIYDGNSGTSESIEFVENATQNLTPIPKHEETEAESSAVTSFNDNELIPHTESSIEISSNNVVVLHEAEDQKNSGGVDNNNEASLSYEDYRIELYHKVVAILGNDRRNYVLSYSLLAPFTRSSVPAIHYAEVFPEKHQFFRFDVGQDILGYGMMPTDGHVVWNYAYPYTKNGVVSAPFQFIFYSQVGLLLTGLLSFLVGAGLSIFWSLSFSSSHLVTERVILAGLCIVFAINISLDSVRGSIFASSGLIWPIIMLLILFFIRSLLSGIIQLKTKLL